MTEPPRDGSDPPLLLILEDDDLVGLLVSTVAELEGLAVQRHAGPGTFFAALDHAAPTHILMDMTLPGLAGEDVLRELASRDCRARIVIASGVDPQRLRDASALAQRLGLTLAAVLRKPFMPAALRASLAST